MKIEQILTEKLIPYARNAKKHDAAQVSKLAGSIREFGFNNPVLIDKDNGIIAGHGRVMAAQKLELKDVPCIRLGHLTDTQRRAYILADNRLAEIGGGWDQEILKLELADLGDLDFDLDSIGFGSEDLAGLDMEDEPETSDADAEPQIDKAEELRAKWGVEPGQLWELGDHRLLCGDSTSRKSYEKLLNGEAPEMVWTDPPYGVAYSGAGGKAIEGDITNTAISGFFPLACEVIKQGGAIYMCGGSNNIPLYYKMYEVHCRMLPQVLIWNKENFTLRRHGYHSQYEIIFFGWTQGGGRREEHWWGDRKQPDIWTIKRDGNNEFHPTQKPVELCKIAIERSAPAGGIVLEPFNGSGSALIACEQLGRKMRAIEMSTGFVAVALQRWADATGKEPKRLV